MCTSPLYRIPVKEFLASSLFKLSDGSIPGYKNGAFVLPLEAVVQADKIISTIRHVIGDNYADEVSAASCQVPCGKCLECKINNSKQWAQRSVAESTMHSDNWFVTLTYDDEHIPESMLTYSRHTFEFGSWHPLVYEDFQLFKKRLLAYMSYHFGVKDIRFMMCGEYGPTNGRPHFHVIFYGLPLPDVVKHCEVSLSGRNYVYLTSEIISNAWSKGFVTIGECNWETSAYVARYVLKKFNNLEEYDYQKLCYNNGWEPLPPEMREASRRPGLGRPYYDEHKGEIYPRDKVVLPNGQVLKPCSYFDNLFDLEDPELLELLKQDRRCNAQIRERNERANHPSEKSYKCYKKNKQEKFARSINKLKRPL